MLVFGSCEFLFGLFEHTIEQDESLALLLELEGLVLGSSKLLGKDLAVVVVGSSHWLRCHFVTFLGSRHECFFHLDVFIGNFLKDVFLEDFFGLEFALPGEQRAHPGLDFVLNLVELIHQRKYLIIQVQVIT